VAKPKAKNKSASGGWRGRLTRTLAGGLRERAQLLELLREAAKRGLLDADAMAMVEGALTMAELQARDLMVARAEMLCIRRGDPLSRILPAVVESGHSRFPVVDGDRDDVVGILLAKDLLRAASAAGSGAQGSERPPYWTCTRKSPALASLRTAWLNTRSK